MKKNNKSKKERLKTGAPGLDDILNGGLIPQRLYLLEGEPGSGKTTLSLQFLLEGLKDGEKCLYVTLSETAEELSAGAESHGWSLEGVKIVELIADAKELDGQTRVTMYHPAEVELGETVKRVLDAIEKVNPSRIVFDSLSEMRLLAQNPLRYRRQILAMKQFFIGRRCTVLLLDDGTSEGPDLQLRSIAHGVISLEQFSPVYGAARRRLRVMKFRGTDFRGGYHDFRIQRGGLAVFPRLVVIEHGESFEAGQVKSGVTALDALLGGGPDRGTSTLLMGPAGSGKSTIAVQYAVAAAKRGERSAVFAFDESIATLEARTEALGIKFKECWEAGQVRVQQVNPAELSPGEFAYLVRQSVEKDQVRVILMDSLNGYMSAMAEERLLTVHLHELLRYMSRQGVTTLMVAAEQGLIGGNVQSAFATSYLADSVILFRYFEYAGKVKKAISVLKKRSGAHEESIRELRFDKKGIHLSKPLTQFRGIMTGTPLVELEAEKGES